MQVLSRALAERSLFSFERLGSGQGTRSETFCFMALSIAEAMLEVAHTTANPGSKALWLII